MKKNEPKGVAQGARHQRLKTDLKTVDVVKNQRIGRDSIEGSLFSEQSNENDTSTVLAPTAKALSLEGKLNLLNHIEGPKDALCVKYSEEYNYIGVGYCDGVLRIYHSNNGESVVNLSDKEVSEPIAPITGIEHRPVSKNYPTTNSFTCTYGNGCVKCWSYTFNQCLYTIREKRQIFGITYHPRIPKFITYGDDCKVYLYDEESKTQERILSSSESSTQHNGHTSRVFAACFNPRSTYELITGGWDDTVQFWDVRQPHSTRHITGVHMCGEGLDINLKGTEILTCSFQKASPAQLWDYGSGKMITSIESDLHNSKLYCGRYAAKDYMVNGGTDPNILRIVDLQATVTCGTAFHLPSAVYGLDLGPPKKSKKQPDSQQPSARSKADTSTIPKIAFITGKNVYQIEFQS